MQNKLNNRFLFSHHYLERICQEADDRTEAAQLIADLRGWASGWDDSSLSSLMTTQIQPTLVSLGFNYQEPSDGNDPHLVRLYTSYRKENQVGLCYVAHREQGETDLDCTIKGRHYAAEIIHALKEEELSWGLLTDGERWRIYHANELAPYETFLEIDLGQLLRDRGSAGRGDPAYLLRTLFTKSAFEVDENGKCALDRHLTASEKEASAIEKHLSKCIEGVLRDLCQGFVERDGRETYASDQRDEVFRNATVLLYRLLFILYAEARDLLPLEVPEYHAASLDALVERAAQYVKVSGLPDPDGTGLWQDLSDLCSWINSGDEDHHIPAYNGDLFDDSDKRYIHDHTIADKYLAPALFRLGAIEDDSKSGYRRIDYRDLSVRHLGSIYEGLLEVKLFIAQERRVRRSDGKGGYTFPKLSETRLKKGEEDQVIGVGQVYFADSAGERKAMGAYYTPEYIVDYIVQQTVRRGLEERRASLKEQLPGWLKEVETAPPGERHRLQKVVDEKLLDFVEQEVLTFRVCDPAMGSGHFLVNAVYTITTFIVETLNLTPWKNAEIDSDPVMWRRRVAKRCLYGVDLNALAVELAKLSLWLSTAAKGKPLSFLDHHLRQGNSLIGARLEDLIELFEEPTGEDEEQSLGGQMSMFDAHSGFHAHLKEATNLVHSISARIADAAEDVESQAADYERVRRELEPYRDLADVVTAQHFGLEIEEDQLRTIAHCLLEDQSRLVEDHRVLLAQACKLSCEQSFFHWDLEFPEVFIGREPTLREQDGGFDAVVGNPPYGYRMIPTKREKSYLANHYQSHQYDFENYVYFTERGVRLLNCVGRQSYILPHTYLSAASMEGFRHFLTSECSVQEIAYLGLGVFEGVVVESVIQTTQKRRLQSGVTVRLHSELEHSTSIENAGTRVYQIPRRRFGTGDGAIFNIYLSPERLSVTSKMTEYSSELKEVAYVTVGINTGYIRDVLVSDTKEDERYHSMISGRNVGRYCLNWNGQWICYDPELVRSYGDRARTLPPEYIFEEEKLLFQRTRRGLDRKLVGTLDRDAYYNLNRVSNVVVDEESHNKPEFLLAVLNARLLDRYFNWVFSEYEVKPVHLRKLPIRRVHFTTSRAQRDQIVAKLIGLYEQEECSRLLAQVDAMLPKADDGKFLAFQARASGAEENSDVVHDLLAYLGECMIQLHEQRQDLQQQVDLFRFADRGVSFVRLDDVLVLDEHVQADDAMDLETVHHDIDGLRLVPNDDGTWMLKVQAKFRDPEQDWQDWIKEKDGYMIKRQWVPAYRLQMSEEKARFYRYALPRLQDFDNASSFPGGYTRSTLKKLHLTKVPMMLDVDLTELARLDRELSETKRKIEVTDDLIDQIVYKLYGLTEEEIAIVEGQT